MKKLAITIACSTLLAGCASVWTATDYTPYVGDDTVYVGNGGAMEVMGGVEVWKQGLPHKPYKIVGMISGEIMDGWGAEDWMMTACAEEAKKNGADAIIKQSTHRQAGTPYVNVQQNSTTINQTNVANVYGNRGAVAVVQGNAAAVRNNPWAATNAQLQQNAAMLMAAGKMHGTFLAIKYVPAE
nr:MAG TPA: RcsF lipoprotein [Caudoviricetes sp.]